MRYAWPIGLSLLLLLGALAWVMSTVERQTLRLVAEERERVQSLYVHARERELQHYVLLARAATERLAAEGGEMAPRKRQALAVLARMRFGQDGYFFVYDRDGRVLLDPGQMDTPGVEFCEPDEPAGQQQAKLILATAERGGGLVRYAWAKPASPHPVPKMSYVTRVEPWGWTLGAGLYLDEVEARLQELDARARDSIAQIHQRIATIAGLALGLAGLGWLTTVLWQQRRSQHRLFRMVERLGEARQGERQRLGRELHDGVGQVMVSTRHLIESAQRHAGPRGKGGAAADGSLGTTLQTCLARLDEALSEIRRLSHGMASARLEEEDLTRALAVLVAECQAGCPMMLSLQIGSLPRDVPADQRLAVLRIVQEGINNACRHSLGSRLDIRLAGSVDGIHLRLQDDGAGFDVAQADAAGGIGLRNMQARAAALGGRLQVRSSALGTTVDLHLPWESTPEEEA
ncbi:cache domain-containing protein [Achromobacter sp. GG226]|uniref:cache domain-containing protein n=1 Tax=Verticiella alkaliphila TaxID=2779529 RepID=UPI001C0E8972|nr:cache domain-containing protein [Verticiella sp. GG226]MBU4609320.1 cache domain-containing protein [Verticiella sp. GG226]